MRNLLRSIVAYPHSAYAISIVVLASSLTLLECQRSSSRAMLLAKCLEQNTPRQCRNYGFWE